MVNMTSDVADTAFAMTKTVVEQFIEVHGDSQTGCEIFIHDTYIRLLIVRPKDVQGLHKGNTKLPELHRDLKEAVFFKPRGTSVDKVGAQSNHNAVRTSLSCL